MESQRSCFSISIIALAVAAAVSATRPAGASEWGCKVLLCLASPGSPTQYSECVPQIEKLWRHLAKGRDFPSCDFAGTSDVQVAQGYERYYPCREGYVFVRGDRRDSDRAKCRSTTRTRSSRDGDIYHSYDAARRYKPRWIQMTVGGQSYTRHWW